MNKHLEASRRISIDARLLLEIADGLIGLATMTQSCWMEPAGCHDGSLSKFHLTMRSVCRSGTTFIAQQATMDANLRSKKNCENKKMTPYHEPILEKIVNEKSVNYFSTRTNVH